MPVNTNPTHTVNMQAPAGFCSVITGAPSSNTYSLATPGGQLSGVDTRDIAMLMSLGFYVVQQVLIGGVATPVTPGPVGG
jgi:hypothetical protein